MATARKEKKAKDVTPWRPFPELTRWDRDMDRWFGDFFDRSHWPFRGTRWWPGREVGIGVPAVDLFEDKGEIVAKAELPGIGKDDVDVNITDNRLIIRGEKKKEAETKDENYYRCERSYGSFTRTIDLPAGVETEKARASFKNGVLEIRVPKSEAAKKKEKKIKVE